MNENEWTLTVSEIGGTSTRRPYHTWRHNSTGIEVQGEPVQYGRPWSAMRQQSPGAGWEFLEGKPAKQRRRATHRSGAPRTFATPEAAAKAALTAWR